MTSANIERNGVEMGAEQDEDWKRTLRPPQAETAANEEAMGLANRSLTLVDFGVTELGTVDQPLPGLTDQDIIRLPTVPTANSANCQQLLLSPYKLQTLVNCSSSAILRSRLAACLAK